MLQDLQNIDILKESLQLYTDVCRIIDDTRNRVAIYVNSEVCLTVSAVQRQFSWTYY